MKEIGVYIHIPFCLSKCYYCDFLSFSNKEHAFESYVKALKNEIETATWLMDYNIKSIFFGGGTPTILPDNLIKKLVDSFEKYNLNTDCEITIEANPETLNLEKLRNLKSTGINRLSIGLQSADDKDLEKLGRIHSFETFEKNYNNAIKIGFKNINIDLIFALPNQTPKMWQHTLTKIINLNPKHISAYSLIIEKNTPFSNMLNKGLLQLPDEKADRYMYNILKNSLKENDYIHYEISNFAKQGYESIHNKIYWQRENYIGFGLGAHSLINNKRFANTTDLENYINNTGNLSEDFEVSFTESMEEYIFLGLRLLKGICISEFEKTFNVSVFDIYGDKIFDLLADGFLEVTKERISLTDKGIDVSNIVFSKILA